MGKITFAVITKNEEQRIEGCLSGAAWADEILVLDSLSTDRTIELSRRYTDKVFQNEFVSFPNQRNRALDLATGGWVLFVDADERLTPELIEEIKAVVRRSDLQTAGKDVGADASVRPGDRWWPDLDEEPSRKAGTGGVSNSGDEDISVVGYWIPRKNIIWGKWIRHGGWYPDYQLRLLRRGSARYDEVRQVHELVVLQGHEGHLSNTFVHYNYDSVAQFLKKQSLYCRYQSQTLFQRGVRVKIWSPLLQATRAIKRRLWDLQGYRDGAHGLLLSVLLGYYEFVVYFKLLQMQRLETRRGPR